MKDYDVFYVVGRMYWEGALNDAYRADALWDAQERILGSDSPMLWAYPPQFNFVAAALALMPIWLGYLVFTASSFIAYLLILRRLAGPHDSVILIALFPVMMICIRIGQNGFLIGALLGLLAVLMLAGRRAPGAGLPGCCWHCWRSSRIFCPQSDFISWCGGSGLSS